MEQLKQVLAQNDTVLFIGSGISLWSGLPSWSKLIEELAAFIEKGGENADLIRNEANRGDLLQAASYGFDKLTKQQIGEFIRTTCKYGIAKPHDIHQKIVSLGPSCFVTTNYDNLIEESLRLWQQERFYRPPVTNRHLTETADIVQARATNFVFKPHGDAGDSESIILTREQYRQLLPGGERHAALESVKMLLASRPVVYLGFGLRDPDFIYLHDLLYNTYKGGIRDHFAIMADTANEEVNYWRRNYGIQLIDYQTTEAPDGSRDHSNLLLLLDELSTITPPSIEPMIISENITFTPKFVLALARYAGRLTRFVKNEPEFPIRVHIEYNRPDRRTKSFYQHYKFDYCPVELFLDDGPDRALLLGLPGGGKSYSLKRAAANLGEKLNQACLAESFDVSNIIIPILIDLKLYRGSLRDLLEQCLPVGLSIDFLCKHFKLKFYLDSFNEMPREYLEKGACEADFAHFINSLGNATLVISSRTSDGLSKLDIPTYYLDEIDEKFVKDELHRRQLKIDGRFGREVLRLLQKPFYFQLYISDKVELSSTLHPRDIFQSFFQNLSVSFKSSFNISFDLEKALSLVAYDTMNSGKETQPLSRVLQLLKNQLQGTGFVNIDPSDIANWLVSQSILIPYIGGKIAFFHQTVTEFLAASELARRYQVNPQILKEKLSITCWDQALFLTLSFLPEAVSDEFFKSVIETDFVLGLNASKYLEVGRNEVVTKLLSEIPNRINGQDHVYYAIEHALSFSVPVNEGHEVQLRKIMDCRGMLGAKAVKLLVGLKGASIKDEMLQAIFDFRDDYNYCCNGIAVAISDLIKKEDLATIVMMADSIEKEIKPETDKNIADGFISGVGSLLSSIDLAAIRDAFLPSETIKQIPNVRSRILCNLLQSQHSTAALEMAAELLLRGVNKAATAIYFISRYPSSDNILSWSSFSEVHIDHLLSILHSQDEDTWTIRALLCLCASRSDLAEVIKLKAMKEHGILKAILLYCYDPSDSAPIFDALAELVKMDDKQRRNEPVFLLDQLNLNWLGQEALMVQLLKLHDAKLALAIMDYDSEDALGVLEIGPIECWLDWLIDEKDPELRWWLQYRISVLFENHLTSEVREMFVSEFNRPGSKYRKVLANSILLTRDELNTDRFSEEAKSFLLANLKENNNFMRGSVLGRTATESFVTERLLPLLSISEEPFASNLRQVLRDIGSRHGRRYVGS
ncbi:MAG: SIR2 family protein [Phycisphaerae bacterium]|nr:SIR2 family protein [Phycisphaerae bacterium]